MARTEDEEIANMENTAQIKAEHIIETDLKNVLGKNEKGEIVEKHKKKKSKKMTPLRKSFYPSFYAGLTAALDGLKRAISTPYVKRTFFRSIRQFALSLIILTVISFLLILPVRFILAVISIAVDVSAMQESLTIYSLFWELALFLPQFIGILMTLTHPSYLDKVFLFTLDNIDEDLSNFLRTQQPTNFGRTLAIILERFTKKIPLIVAGMGILILSSIPFVGRLAIPLAQFYFTYTVFGTKFSLLLSAVSLIPMMDSFATTFLKLWLSSAALGFELLEVYFSRIRSNQQESYIKREFFAEVLGFAMPFTVLLSIPFGGIFLYGFAQGACACLLKLIMVKQTKKLQLNEEGTIDIKGQDVELERAGILYDVYENDQKA